MILNNLKIKLENFRTYNIKVDLVKQPPNYVLISWLGKKSRNYILNFPAIPTINFKQCVLIVLATRQPIVGFHLSGVLFVIYRRYWVSLSFTLTEISHMRKTLWLSLWLRHWVVQTVFNISLTFSLIGNRIGVVSICVHNVSSGLKLQNRGSTTFHFIRGQSFASAGGIVNQNEVFSASICQFSGNLFSKLWSILRGNIPRW